MADTIHPEDALSNAGASDGYYEIVGASYTPADAASGAPATATIDLSTVDQTGCLLTHNYATGETTLKWDTEPGPGHVRHSRRCAGCHRGHHPRPAGSSGSVRGVPDRDGRRRRPTEGELI